MYYPAKFTPAEEGGYVVTFRDIPEAITQGDDMTEAVEMAEDVLQSAMDFYFEDQRPAPLPSAPEEGERNAGAGRKQIGSGKTSGNHAARGSADYRLAPCNQNRYGRPRFSATGQTSGNPPCLTHATPAHAV